MTCDYYGQTETETLISPEAFKQYGSGTEAYFSLHVHAPYVWLQAITFCFPKLIVVLIFTTGRFLSVANRK